MDNFAESVYRASGNLDNLGKASRRLGLTTDQLQRIRIQAEAAGIQTNVLDTAFQRFARRIGSGSLDKTFKELNISIRDAHGNLKSNFQLWNEFGKKLSSLEDKNRQLALAMNAVDTEGVKLVELWRSSQSSIDAVNRKIRDYGLLFDKSMIDKAEAYQTEVGLIRRAHEAVETKISMGLSRMAGDWETLKLKISEAKYAVLDYFGAFGTHADSPEVRGQKLLDELKILNSQRARLEAAYRNARSEAERADLEERLRINRTYLKRNLEERKKILKVLEGKDNALEPKVGMG
ncbi:MAG TPA: hypothetical protein ENJ98_02630, partial [Thiolapillus brandeum]|nr:hypothetical protein [Thiolapillus brandeum]